MVYLFDTMVDLFDAIVDLSDTRLDLPDAILDLPDTMVDLPDTDTEVVLPRPNQHGGETVAPMLVGWRCNVGAGWLGAGSGAHSGLLVGGESELDKVGM